MIKNLEPHINEDGVNKDFKSLINMSLKDKSSTFESQLKDVK